MKKIDFSSPSPQYCPLQIIHGGFPKEQEEIDLFLDDAEERDIGGFVINYPSTFCGGDPEQSKTYMTDPEGFESLRRFAQAASDRSFRLWLYDEAGYPSGSAGRLVYQCDPSFAVKGLVCHSQRAEGPCEGSMEVPDPGRTMFCGALQLAGTDPDGEPVLRQTGMIQLELNAEGKVFYQLPKGEWVVVHISARPLQWFSDYGDPYIDLLNPDAAQAFVEATHRKYEKELGSLLSRFEAIFTDEPSLPTHGCGSHFFETDPLVPWTDGLDRDFIQRFGYELTPRLWELFYYGEKSDGHIRQDFWQWIGERFRDSFFDPIYRWGARTGVNSTGHMYGEESLSMQIALNGDLFGLFCRMQMPGVDRLYSTRPRDLIPEKTASSAAHVMGRGEAMSESSFHFESNFWDLPISVEKMMETGSYQAVLGITQTASYYPYHIQERDAYQRYMGRLYAFARTGIHRAPLLCLIPMEQARKEYLPRGEKIWNIGPMPVSPRATAGCRRIEQAYGTVLEKLMSRQLDFDLIDRSHFLLSSCAPQGILCQREQYSALVAFAVGQPDNALLEQLYECAFHKIPIVLVTVDGMPVCEDYLALHREYDDMVFLASSEECATLAAQLLPLSEEIKRGPQGDAFEKGRDFTFTRPNPNVWVRETVTEEGEMLLLLHNRGDRPARVEIKIKNGEAPLSVDFSTGETFEPEGRLENGHLFFTVEIPPHLARGAIVKRNIPEK